MKKSVMLAAAAGALAFVGSAAAEETKAPASWADTLKLGGDFRFRHEYIDQDGKEERQRQRIRARVGLTAKPSDEVTIGFQLSTSEGGDPVAGNQTLDNGFSRKDVFIDLAYLDWHPGALEGLNFVGGKMPMPFHTVGDLVWDGDLNPEGVAIKGKFGGDGLDLFVNAGGFWVDERSSTTDDAMLYGAQAGAKLKQDDFSVLGAVGLYQYENLEGYPTLVDEEDGFGNSTSGGEEDPVTGEVSPLLYATGFEILDAIAEVGFNAGLPVSLFGNLAINNDADEDDTAFQLGFKLGKTKDPGSFDFGYSYREVEANAVLGAFSDSDFLGGGTDGKGHKVALGYQINKILKAGLTYFMSEIGLDGDSTDYDRLQLDLAAKF